MSFALHSNPKLQTLYALAKQQTTSNALLSNLRLEGANSHDLGNMFSPYRHSERSRGIFVIFLRRTADTILLHETRLAAYSENTAFPISLSTHSSHLPPTKKIPPLRPPDVTGIPLSQTPRRFPIILRRTTPALPIEPIEPV